MRRKVLCLYLLAIAFLLISPSAQAADPIRNYQIDVISIQTSLGVENVTEKNSQEIIDKINSGFNEMIPGSIRFTFRKLYPTLASNLMVNSSSQLESITGIKPKADPGYEGAILIGVITKNPANGFGGMAGGDYMLMNGGWSLSNALTVTHELGHNLGLLHANSATCTTQLPIVCDQREYGDYSSFMGNYVNGYVSQPYISRLSATELDKLRVLPANKRSFALVSGTYNLSPVYSTSSDLPKVLYIPIANQNAYSVEYRPAIGNDSSLGLSRVNSLTENWSYNNIPSHGLQLRILRTDTKEFPSLLPKLNNFERFETALVSDSLTGPQVHPVGKSFTLSDGSIVTFISQDPVIGAVVKVVRPTDTEAPKFSNAIARWEPSTYWIAATGERLIRKKNPTEWVYPVIEIPLNGILDNRQVKKITLEVNGKEVQVINDLSLITSDSLKYQTMDEGKFNLRLTATDYAGNVGTSVISSLTTTYTRLTKPGVVANQGKDPYTSIKFSFYRSGADTSYQLSELSSGKIESIEEVNQILTITVIDITRNSNFSAKLIGTNPVGYSDDGQVITGQPRKYEIKPPFVRVSLGDDRYTMVNLKITNACESCKYSLSNLNSGKVKSVENANGVTTIVIDEIKRNQRVKATLTGNDSYGFSDGGQEISADPFPYEILPPFVRISLGDDPYTMVNLKITNACQSCTYSLSNLTSGKVKSVESTNGVTTIVIDEIQRNQSLKATLTGNDSYGFNDGGLEISADPSLYEILPPSISYRYGSDPRTSVVITFRDACATCTYSIVELIGGVISKTEKVEDQNSITISNISRNSGFRATLIGSDTYGFNDSGQEISENVQGSFCDNSLCYQGMDWVVNTGYWPSGTGNMSLQELVKGKWVTVKTAKPIVAQNNLPKYPSTFAITIKNVSAGKRTYRLSISAKGKYSVYVGKSFTQVVKP